MTITALPVTTVRLLNSAQVLTTPVSLVKELVDNALDAKASSIDILISPNTLDKVEVRDNGHGIQVEDLDALARHGHTSKLRSFEELKLLGGVTLGFRGEALASAVQLGEVTITTKTEGESVGTMVKLKVTGGIDHQTRTSHPVGTTVSVTNFMAKLPVRKKTFEKEATKSIAKIHRLLQAYALARPSIRLSLKVSKGGKGSWSFIPHPSGDVREAVLRAISRDTALQCIEMTVQSGERKQSASLVPEVANNAKGLQQFTMDAFLPSPQADPSKIGVGQYLSIDSRPVSHEKGTMKKIVTIFKKHIRGSLDKADDKLKFPFLRLNIKCPAASYDANVEPAKDDVLFGNEDLVLETVERLFKAVYGDDMILSTTSASKPLAKGNGNPRQPRTLESLPQSDIRGQDFAVTATRSHSAQPRPNQSELPQGDELMVVGNGYMDEASNCKSSKWGFDMSEDFTVQVEGRETRQNRYNQNRNGRAHSIGQMQPEERAHLNPWVIAKKAPQSTGERTTTSSSADPVTPDIRRSREPGRDTLSVANSRHQQPSNLPTSHDRQQLDIDDDSDLFVTDTENPRSPTRQDGFITARRVMQASLISPPHTQPSKISSKVRASRPFVSPFVSPYPNGENEAGPGNLHQSKLLPDLQLSRAHTDDDREVSDNSDLAWAMDFEKRKEDATRRRQVEIRESKAAENELNASREIRSPHKNRYIAATASLKVGQLSFHRSTHERTKKPSQPSPSDDDLDVYSTRQQGSTNSPTITSKNVPKIMLEKSTRLSLETVPNESQIQHLIQPLPTTFNTLHRVALLLAEDNPPVSTFTGLIIAPSEVSAVSKRLEGVVGAWMKGADGSKFEVEYTLANLSHGIV